MLSSGLILVSFVFDLVSNSKLRNHKQGVSQLGICHVM
jgi:hypothetical protein